MNSPKTKMKGKVILKSNVNKTLVNKVKNKPSIKCCHKEVKHTQFQSCSDDSDSTLEGNRCNQKGNRNHKSKDVGHISSIQAEDNKLISRNKLYSQTDFSERVTMPISSAKSALVNKNMQSKSAPLNLDNSVDLIPVRLSPKIQKKKRHNILNGEKSKPLLSKSPREADSGSCRATWDQLLKQESSNFSQQHKSRRCVQTKRNTPLEQNVPSNQEAQKKKVLNTNSTSNCDQVTNPFSEKHPKETSTNLEALTHSMPRHDPVESLDYLIKQLKEKIIKPSDTSNIEKIIVDMENALLKFSNDSSLPRRFLFEEKSTSARNSQTESSVATSKPSTSEAKSKDRHGGASTPAQLQRGLQESCQLLQSLWMKQREDCNDHVKYKEELTLQLAESRRLLAIARTKEKEYEVTIGELRLRLKDAECTQRRADELDALVARLRAEAQTIDSYKEAVKKLNSRLKEISCEKENLQSMLYLKELEVEKLKILLEVKENLKPVSKVKPGKPAEENIVPDNLPDLGDGDKALLSSSLTLTSEADRGALVCSSQASSSPGRSPSPSHSWTHISSIRPRPDDLERRVANMFEDLKRKTSRLPQPDLPRLEVISPDNSFWSELAETS